MNSEISIITILKNLGYIPAIFLGLSFQSYTILAIFMIIDTIAGITRSGTLHGWRSVTSFKLTSGILAKSLIILLPLLIALAGIGIGIDLIFLAKGALGMLILAQLYSIIGNIYAIKVKKDIHEFDAVGWVLLKIKFTVEKILLDTEKGRKK